MVDLDPLVWAVLALSAACFLAFALWPRSSTRSRLEIVSAADDAQP